MKFHFITFSFRNNQSNPNDSNKAIFNKSGTFGLVFYARKGKSLKLNYAIKILLEDKKNLIKTKNVIDILRKIFLLYQENCYEYLGHLKIIIPI